MPQSESHLLPGTPYIEFELPNPEPDKPNMLRLELWEAEQIVEVAYKKTSGDLIAWVREVQSVLEKRYEISFSLYQSHRILLEVRKDWDEFSKKNSPTVDLLSGTELTQADSTPSGDQSS